VRGLLEEALLAIRALRRAPAFALTVIATLALALGGVTAIYSVLYGVVLEPLPFARPGELLAVEDNFHALALETIPVSPRELLELRQEAKSFSALGGYVGTDVNLTGQGEPRRVSAAAVTPSVLSGVLAVKPTYGRLFDEDEDQDGKSNVVLLGAGFHRRAFGGDPAVVGTSLELDGKANRIIGVLPDACDAGVRARSDGKPHDIWIPLTVPADRLDPAARGGRFLEPFARLAPGVSRAAAAAEMHRIALHFQEAFPESYKRVSGWDITVRPMRDYFVASTAPVLYLLFGAVLLVLLAASANVASLTLARVAARQKELAARAALGATSGRLALHVLIEAIVVAIAGGLLGLVVGRLMIDALLGIRGPAVPWADDAGLDGPVLAVAGLFTFVAGLASGLVPAFHVSRLPPAEVLKESSRASGGKRTGRLRALLVAAQVAVSLALLSGALVLVRSLGHLVEMPLGFEAKGVTVANLSLSETHYSDEATVIHATDRILEGLANAPGIEAAGLTTIAPLSGWSDFNYEVEGEPTPSNELKRNAQVRSVEGRYFDALGIRLLEGRFFERTDSFGGPGVIIVNQTLARGLGGDPLTKTLRMKRTILGPEEPLRVVGVVADTYDMGLDLPPKPFVYLPFTQRPFSAFALVARSRTLDGAATGKAIRAVVNAVDPRQPVFAIRPLVEVVEDSLASRRMALVLFGAFAALGVLLAVLGVYGVTSYSVTQRTQELGVRLALGADEGALIALVVGQALRVVGAGLAVGAVLAVVVGRLLAASLAAVEPFDGAAVLAVAIGLLAAGGVASWLPARRVTRLELSHALRAE
jgi:putative ABC transport system permease protein